MQNYKELRVWSKAHEVVLSIYKVTQRFPIEERYGIISQLRRAAYSIPSNIAEGCGKVGKKDLANFLNIAMGSANEVEYLLLLSTDLLYIDKAAADDLIERINHVKAMLISLIYKVRN